MRLEAINAETHNSASLKSCKKLPNTHHKYIILEMDIKSYWFLWTNYMGVFSPMNAEKR